MNHGTIASEPNPLVDAQSVNARAAMYFEETKKTEKKSDRFSKAFSKAQACFIHGPGGFRTFMTLN